MVVPAERALVEAARVAVIAQKRFGFCAADVRRFVGACGTRSGEEFLVTERHWIDVIQI